MQGSKFVKLAREHLTGQSEVIEKELTKEKLAEEEPDYLPGQYSFDFTPQKDVTGYEVLLLLPLLLNLQHPQIGEQLLLLLNTHKEIRRHWTRTSTIISTNGVHRV